MKPEFTRRTILAAGVGGMGLTTATWRATQSQVEHNRRITVGSQQPNATLEVAWAEWYNGEKQEGQEPPTDREGDAPVITLTDLLPDDSGKAHFELELADDSGPNRAQVWMRVRTPTEDPVDSFEENGRNEPERLAGDDTGDRGELQDHTETTVWYDSGTLLSEPCTGEATFGEQRLVEDASLGEVLTGDTDPTLNGDGVAIDANPGSEQSCLQRGNSVCIGLTWSISGDTQNADGNVNIIQGDSAEFLIEFAITNCGAGSPWA